MAVDNLQIKTNTTSYNIEANPDNSGIRVIKNIDDDSQAWVATIIDDGDGFTFATLKENGVFVQKFHPTARLLFKDGFAPALDVENQVVVETIHNRKMVVRELNSKEKYKGVVIAYSDGICLYSVAICHTPQDDTIAFNFSS